MWATRAEVLAGRKGERELVFKSKEDVEIILAGFLEDES